MRKTGLIKLISLMLLALIFLPLNFAWAWAIAPDLPREPVIIVPGILGSWKKQGEWVIDPILHTYDNLYNTLKQAGYMPDMDLYTFAYDWSVSNALTAWDLKNRINEIKTANNVSLVDLVVHSMGGLVARQYIESDYYDNDIDQVIFLGTPHNGATKTYLKWEGAAGFDGPKEYLFKKILQIKAYIDGYDDLYDYIHEEVASVQELLPIYDYLTDKDTGQTRDYPENYPRNTFLENLNSAENLQKFIDSGVNASNIVSDSDAGTLNTITVEDSDDDKLWEHGEPVNYGYSDGDGTVPIHSAKGFIGDYSTVINAAHKDLPTAARQQVAVLLDESLVIEDIGGDTELVEMDDFLFISIHSPVDVLITDSGGNQVGTSSDPNNQIPGAFYSGEDDPEFVTIPNPVSGDYTIKVFGTGQGEYEIKISYLNDNGEEEVKIITGIASPGGIYYHTVNLDNCQLFQADVLNNSNSFGFNDTETSSGNTYSAGTLDFSLNSSQDNFGPRPDVVLNMMPGDSVTREIKIKNEGNLDFQYNGRAEKISGDDDFCAGLQLIAKLNGEIKYDGDLIDFVFSKPLLTAGAEDKWFFLAYLPYDSNFVNKTCQFDFVFQGWQTDVANYGDGGFFDEERIGNIISSISDENSPTPENENLKPDTASGPANHIVINEAQVNGTGEWIELYNPTNNDINLSGWEWGYYSSTKGSWSNSSNHKPLVSGATNTIKAHGYFLFRVAGTVPDFDGDTKYSGNAILANDSGTIAIFNSNSLATSTLVDAVGWGGVTLKEKNSAVIPGANQSIERGLTGYDSDDNSIDFIIKNNPTPVNSSGHGMPDIVINEFLAEGDAWQDFVEIYNASSSAINLDGWRIEIKNDYGTGSTTALSGSLSGENWLVYYFDDNVLRASSTITIYDNNNKEIDKIFYTDADIADKSFARIPDGLANWVDPIPTPGGMNKLEQVAVVETAEQAQNIEIIEQPASAGDETAVEIQEEPIADEQEPNSMKSPSEAGETDISSSTDEIIIEKTSEVIAEPMELIEIKPDPQPATPGWDEPSAQEPELVNPPIDNNSVE